MSRQQVQSPPASNQQLAALVTPGSEREHPLMINENSGAQLPKLSLTSPSAGQSDGEKLEVWPTSGGKSNSS